MGRHGSGQRNLVALTAALLMLAGAAMPVAAADSFARVADVRAGETVLPGGGPEANVIGTRLLPGLWSITAHGSFRNSGAGRYTVRCHLVGDGISDVTFTPLSPESDAETNVASLLSNAVRQITDPNGALVLWRCAAIDAPDGIVSAFFVGLTAIKLSRLTETDLDSGTSTDAGFGNRRAISSHREASRLAGDPASPTDIASIDLPEGDWLVVAKAVARNAGTTKAHLFCETTRTRDETQVWLAPVGTVGNVMSLASYGLATVPAGGASVALQCESQDADDAIAVSRVRLAALRVPSVDVHLYPTPVSSAAPVQLWYHDAQAGAEDELIAKKVPNGDWLLTVKLQVINFAPDEREFEFCYAVKQQNGGAETENGAFVGFIGAEHTISEGTLAFTVAFNMNDDIDGRGKIDVSCNPELAKPSYAQLRLRFVRITFVKVGEIDGAIP